MMLNEKPKIFKNLLNDFHEAVMNFIVGRWTFSSTETDNPVRTVVSQFPLALVDKGCTEDSIISIYCHAINYTVRYTNWLIPNLKVSVFQVGCTAPEFASDRFKAITAKDVYFPEFRIAFMPRKHDMKYLGRCYMDILISRLKKYE